LEKNIELRESGPIPRGAVDAIISAIVVNRRKPVVRKAVRHIDFEGVGGIEGDLACSRIRRDVELFDRSYQGNRISELFEE
jgi:hypothetical protein